MVFPLRKEILKDWPDSGPVVLWRTPLGEGFSSIAVAGGAAYTMFAEGKDEYAICMDAATGEERWRVKTGRNFPDWQGGNGPRATPIIDKERAFFLGAYGQLYALDIKSGETVWSHHFQTEFISDPPHWGYSTSPLIEGNLLIVEVGGSSGNAFIAFDKTTGEVAWASQDDAPSYASPIAITVSDVRQIVFFPVSGLVGVAARDGRFLWRHSWQTGPDVNAATPIFLPPDRLFISSGYGKGATVIQLISQNGQFSVKRVWFNRSMKNHFASSIHHEGYLYGFDNAILKCIGRRYRAGAMAQTRLSKGITHLCGWPSDRPGRTGQAGARGGQARSVHRKSQCSGFVSAVLDATHTI